MTITFLCRILVAEIPNPPSSLWQKIRFFLQNFNLFPSIPPSTDQHQLRNQRISTRIFIILLTLSLTVLILYTSLVNSTHTFDINSPTSTQYSQLYSNYPQTLTCTCTNISIDYGKFIQVNYSLHQICTSIFVNHTWIDYLADARGTDVFYDDDFRASGTFMFQALNAFCQLSNQTISNRLTQFYSSQYVSASVTSLQVLKSQTQAFVSQFKSSITNDFLLSLLTIRTTTQSNSLFSGQLTNYYLVRENNNDVYSYSVWYGNCNCSSSATCAYESPIYDPSDSVLFTVPGIYAGCYIIEALLQSDLQCFYNETCINKIQSYFPYYLSMNLTTLDVSLLVRFSMSSTIQELIDNLMVEKWNNATIYDGYYNECQPSKCSYSYQGNQTISNRLTQFYSSQYVSASVTSLQLLKSQTQAFVSQFKSSITNDSLLSLLTIRTTTQSNSLLSGLLTNYGLDTPSNSIYVYSYSTRYGNCSCASSAKCAYESPIYDPSDNVLFTVPGIYVGCYIIEALLQSNLECFYNETCINQIQSYFTYYLSMNLTTLDASLLVGFSMNSTIEELVDNLMVEEWNPPIIIYDGYYNECQPSKCSYSYETKNGLIYIITTVIGLVGGLITVLKLIVPRVVKFMRRKKEPTRPEAVMNISERIQVLKQQLKLSLQNFNIFPSIPPSTDEYQLRNQRISTRIFIILLTLSLTILILYTSLINITKTTDINSPTIIQYTQLYSNYPQTLTCACTQISINYDKFIQVNYTLHQICTSIFVNHTWISYLANARPNDLFTDDFRASGTFMFQALNAFCQLSNQTISNRLTQFYSSQYISASVTSLQVLKSQTQAFVSQFKSSITNDFLLSLLTIRTTTQSNSLFSGQFTNYYLVRESNNYVDSYFVSHANCYCSSSATCAYESPIYDPSDSVLFTVPGIYAGCYIIEALLQSNLQCLYNETCINQIQSYFTYYLSMNLTTLDVSLLVRFSMNSTIEELVDELMVEEWNNATIYDGYYNECQPSKCSYSYETKNGVIYIITTVIGLVGGLITVLKLIVPRAVRLVMFYIRRYTVKHNAVSPSIQT
ncbi:unnamed protein product [Adineta steineri]|uniref:Uncharacterized protein n=1 Tax=Adineta steineri TaxID=433720 RepID=A0A815RIT1_9BILA|nr:unnamed protein product [Adineta steineri]CAF4012575.1 unnamed protein product [Adineta steineri]